MKARDLMTREVYTCSPDSMLHEAARIMWENDVGFLPVLDDAQQLVGIITDRDICMAAYTQNARLTESKIGSAMSRDVVTCSENSAIREVERLMEEKRIRRIPVVNDAGRLSGIIALGDLIRHAGSRPLRRTTQGPALLKTLGGILRPRFMEGGVRPHPTA